jgi:hypothetical protein
MRQITPADIIPAAEYASRRQELRAAIVAMKRQRRLQVGPYATMHFENFDTMRMQVQEMLHIEKGGAEQLPGELAAYNPLIPNGHELVATVLFEIDDPVRRAAFLGKLGGVEETAFIEVAGMRVAGVAEADQDRSTVEGKASAVQFIHYPFKPAEIAAFKKASARVVVGFDHPAYAHMTVMPEPVRAALAADFD